MNVGRFDGILSLEALGGRDGSRRVSWRISNITLNATSWENIKKYGIIVGVTTNLERESFTWR